MSVHESFGETRCHSIGNTRRKKIVFPISFSNASCCSLSLSFSFSRKIPTQMRVYLCSQVCFQKVRQSTNLRRTRKMIVAGIIVAVESSSSCVLFVFFSEGTRVPSGLFNGARRVPEWRHRFRSKVTTDPTSCAGAGCSRRTTS